LADAAVLKLHREKGLSVVVLRPGLVIGAGTAPAHGGLGFFNNDQFCVGWNDGNNPLPWVLVEDCATAITAALTAPAANGKSYNLVGDVLPTAREYIHSRCGQGGRTAPTICAIFANRFVADGNGQRASKRVAGRKVGHPYRRDILSP
jgi:nucleoside-diphosphate-sugar epimerase